MTPECLEKLRKAGAKGGQTTARRDGPAYYQVIGLKGGNVLFRKRVRKHFVTAGKKSAAVRKARRLSGERSCSHTITSRRIGRT
jgi:hypothetical protein